MTQWRHKSLGTTALLASMYGNAEAIDDVRDYSTRAQVLLKR